MSSSNENDLNLDLHFLPAWAKAPSNRNLYADFQGEDAGRGDRGWGDRPFRRREGGPPRDRQGPRPGGERRPVGGPPRRPGGDRGAMDGRRREEGRGRGGPGRDFRPPAPEPLPELRAAFRPDEKGVDLLARQIRMTGRAYPLFAVAQMILARPDRYTLTFSVKKGPEGQVLQPLFVCALDDTLWLSEQEAVDYALDKHFNTFYQAEKTAIEPPKGTYTFVAQCGLSGTVLGPPNHHDYQNHLRRLHSERFARMPFEVYKSRVKIVRDEAVIKQWLDSQSWRTEYVCLNLPEPLRLGSMEEVEKHFRENHLPIIIKAVESHALTGAAARSLRSGPLQRLVRAAVEDQRRFPLQMATVLSQQFAARSLQFFKVHKNVTYVAVARPHYLDLESTPVSTGIRAIVSFINEHPRCTRRQLIDALVPAPAPAPARESTAPPAAETTPRPEAEAAPAPAPAPPPPETSPEATAVISDLHWLIHQGHVLEFADGLLETAKKPVPRPPKPVAQAAPAEPAPGAAPTAAELAAETPPEPRPEPAAEDATEAATGPSSSMTAEAIPPAAPQAEAVPESAPAAEDETPETPQVPTLPGP